MCTPVLHPVRDLDACCSLSSQLKLGWYCHPIFGPDGDYHDLFKKSVVKLSQKAGKADPLPCFTEEEKKLNKGAEGRGSAPSGLARAVSNCAKEKQMKNS